MTVYVLQRFDAQAYYNGKLLLALFGREVIVDGAREKEHWYRIGGKNYKFGKVEFCQITGLKFGGSSFIPDEHESIPPPENGVYRHHYYGKSVVDAHLLNDFKNGSFAEYPDDALKVAHILVVHYFFFAPDPSSTVPLWLWSLVDEPEMFRMFPWGAYVFQRLHHYLDDVICAPEDGSDVQFNIHAYLMPLQKQATEEEKGWIHYGKVFEEVS
ncbi:Unknown protein [Striga hermonthica]|uniref:DUF1985 domain-containing protein n=1 Tax=Striga hermonthica TaxID=68872 RepID=A0A9N7NTL1_STRHE|nr:Unknown protein [Striga hermonthica]